MKFINIIRLNSLRMWYKTQVLHSLNPTRHIIISHIKKEFRI